MNTPLRASLSAYRILRQIGKGGMAEVFLAQRTADASPGGVANEKLVALKRILPHFAADPRVRELLLEEARLGAGFNHPHLVEAYDVGVDGDACFFTMEWVRGHELRYLIRGLGRQQRSMTLANSLTIAGGIASGLHYAHSLSSSDGIPLQVVHLDVCPSNVLVTHEGYVKLIDFGVAQTVRNTAVRADDSYAGMVPAPGAATVRRGTLAYMSPEQVLGQPVDRRSDVFSLGIMLWEMTMWKRLFRADNHTELVHRIVSGDVPRPTSLRPDYPTWLERIVMTALARSPHDRFESAIDLRMALEDFAFQFSIPMGEAALGGLVSELFDPVELPAPSDPGFVTPSPVMPSGAPIQRPPRKRTASYASAEQMLFAQARGVSGPARPPGSTMARAPDDSPLPRPIVPPAARLEDLASQLTAPVIPTPRPGSPVPTPAPSASDDPTVPLTPTPPPVGPSTVARRAAEARRVPTTNPPGPRTPAAPEPAHRPEPSLDAGARGPGNEAAPSKPRVGSLRRGSTPFPEPGAGPDPVTKGDPVVEEAEALARRFQSIGTRWRGKHSTS